MDGFSTEAINNYFIHNPIFTVSIGISAVIALLVYALGFSKTLKKEIKKARMKQHINQLKDHHIVCGYGRVGQQIAQELASDNQSFIIIERDEDKLHYAKEHNWPYLVGDVALDETLFEKARINTAKTLIIAVGSDADAIFMAVSARAMHKDIFIVARASSIEVGDKLSKIGVNRVALPYQIGGYQMATMAIRPTVVDFLDILVDSEREELEMEEYLISENGFYDGKSLGESGFVSPKVAVLAIRHKDGKCMINPKDSVKLNGGDRLVVMGDAKMLHELTKAVEKQQLPKKDFPQAASVLVADVKPSPFIKHD
jgi:voltage-gated potassium channel